MLRELCDHPASVSVAAAHASGLLLLLLAVVLPPIQQQLDLVGGGVDRGIHLRAGGWMDRWLVGWTEMSNHLFAGGWVGGWTGGWTEASTLGGWMGGRGGGPRCPSAAHSKPSSVNPNPSNMLTLETLILLA